MHNILKHIYYLSMIFTFSINFKLSSRFMDFSNNKEFLDIIL